MTPLYDVFFGAHRSDLWGDYLAGLPPAVHGNAVLLRKGLVQAGTSAVREAVPLSADGNAALVVSFECAGSDSRGTRVAVCASHLETEAASKRKHQVAKILDYFDSDVFQGGHRGERHPGPGEGPGDGGDASSNSGEKVAAHSDSGGTPGGSCRPCVLIWGGDFNASRDAPEMAAAFASGFTDASVHATLDGPSDFGAEGYGWIDTPIDHVLAKGHNRVEAARPCHPGARVRLHRGGNGSGPSALGPRLEWTLRTFGSDHMPVGCTLVL
jgi:endonuclease/exonuclease/phosphatase family metal-dependent hydrolase